MRQTAVKAVPFAKSGAKPQRESDETKNIEKRWGKIPELFQARSRVYYHSEVRTPIAKAMFGEKQKNLVIILGFNGKYKYFVIC